MEWWSDAFKTQYSNIPILQYSNSPLSANLDGPMAVVVDLPVMSRTERNQDSVKGGEIYGW